MQKLQGKERKEATLLTDCYYAGSRDLANFIIKGILQRP